MNETVKMNVLVLFIVDLIKNTWRLWLDHAGTFKGKTGGLSRLCFIITNMYESTLGNAKKIEAFKQTVVKRKRKRQKTKAKD